MKKIVLGFLVLLLAAILGAVGWYQFIYIGPRYSPEDPLALDALRSDLKVEVSTERWVVMQPSAGASQTAMIFYPGGQVAPEGYAEPLRGVAEAGYLVVMVPMPLNLAVIAPNRADAVIEAFPDVSNWVIAGHSLGGAMAARYAYMHPGKLAGLLLWDAYPPDTDDLSAVQLPIRQIHRVSDDGEVPEVYRKTRHLLPDDMQIVTLPGANHMNFGRFFAAERFKEMDPDYLFGSMPIEEQHASIVEATVGFLGQFAEAE